ncbi:ammonium transporter [Dethiosulfatarculus sandiegensis]|uniref:Ammonium transporter n=1 Tax=Dethiosulfatarculus sandiegensis TaxID=1429043 RepID=A0A0D2HNH8_9BACT|nr:ammonium transporter [Dethiosulfatarculus sandiegensis]KIX12118.1 ammonium transporter [Dethiosulfatarculus sandiegensis]
MTKPKPGLIALITGAFLLIATPALAAEAESTINDLDTVWILLAAYLVFFMQPGFALLETGLTRAKNTINIIAKNFMDMSVAVILFFFFGYGLMYGSGNSFIGLNGFALSGLGDSNVPIWASFIFQAVFCATAATIVSGAVAERIKFISYLIATGVLTALIYPIIGHWTWGGGWLAGLNFFDFAGSTIVHSTGGWAALIGAWMLGPREGKYDAEGKAQAICGHNLPLAALGVFILWFGWFGFNPGSQLAASGIENAKAISLISVNTILAPAAGALTAMLAVWIGYGKPDLTFCMNGALAGLVAITAPCAVVSPVASILIGAIGGVLVVLSARFFDLLHIDDPVGAVSVHGVNGVWGTLAVGLWGQKALGLASDGLFMGGGLGQLGVQALGVVSVAAFTLVTMGVVFFIVDHTIGLRVTRTEELRGLDIDEHGMEGYSDFQIFTTR